MFLPAGIERVPVAVRAFLAHCGAVSLTAGVIWMAPALPMLGMALVEGAFAAAISTVLRLPPWWVPIQLGFAPLAVTLLALRLDPLWYLAGFAAMALVFGAVHSTRVPLYPTSEAALAQLLACLPAGGPVRVLDLGCGTGGVIAHVAHNRLQAHCAGIEAAPIPWLTAFLRGKLSRPGFRVQFGSFWGADLGKWDVVFAYLSPAAMARLGDKAEREMRPGSMLICNSFPLPGRDPSVRHAWGTSPFQTLFVYRY